MNSFCEGTLAIALAIFLGSPPPAAQASEISVTPERYARPGRLVPITDGRKLNLRCEGKGPRTILLEAGTNADSSAWFKVQPLLSKQARVCAYDRASYGFSDGRRELRDIDAEVDDLHALMGAAKIPRPAIFVGHSMGTNIVRRYATRYPAEVAGMVLADPPPQGLGRFMSPAWMKDDVDANAERDAFLTKCEQAAARHALDRPAGELAQCIDKPAPWMSAAVAAMETAVRTRPAYWHTFRAELAANASELAQSVSPAENHGSIPITVLAAADTFEGVPEPDRANLEAARKATHAAIAASSSRGVVTEVRASGHDIELDQPSAIVDAVNRLAVRPPVRP